MNISIRASKSQQKELLEKGFPENITVNWVELGNSLTNINADAFFDFVFNDMDIASNDVINNKPVFVHALSCTCKQINKPNYIRLNAWEGFLKRPITELACYSIEYKQQAETVFNSLKWQYTWVEDGYGLIAARIIAMIINEAYFALEEKVSTKQQIDIAMRLGTNYPHGPFEWSEKIGLQSIVNLLQQLSVNHDRYLISELLVQESKQTQI